MATAVAEGTDMAADASGFLISKSTYTYATHDIIVTTRQRRRNTGIALEGRAVCELACACLSLRESAVRAHTYTLTGFSTVTPKLAWRT